MAKAEIERVELEVIALLGQTILFNPREFRRNCFLDSLAP
jgi:hypothetical protein